MIDPRSSNNRMQRPESDRMGRPEETRQNRRQDAGASGTPVFGAGSEVVAPEASAKLREGHRGSVGNQQIRTFNEEGGQ
jgi:hypothetical protein